MNERTTSDPQERQRVISAETALWTSAAGKDRQRLEWLLHEDFSAITCDGDAVSREAVAGSTARDVEVGDRTFSDWAFHEMPWPLVLVTYHLDEVDRCSRHMSIWDVSTGSARIRFHQGTWVTEDETAEADVLTGAAFGHATGHGM